MLCNAMGVKFQEKSVMESVKVYGSTLLALRNT